MISMGGNSKRKCIKVRNNDAKRPASCFAFSFCTWIRSFRCWRLFHLEVKPFLLPDAFEMYIIDDRIIFIGLWIFVQPRRWNYENTNENEWRCASVVFHDKNKSNPNASRCIINKVKLALGQQNERKKYSVPWQTLVLRRPSHVYECNCTTNRKAFRCSE